MSKASRGVVRPDEDDSDHEVSKVAVTKRRKIDTGFLPTFKQDLSSDEDEEEEEDATDISETEERQDGPEVSKQGIDVADGDDLQPSRKTAIKPLTTAELEAVNAARARTGVVYLSKVPPFMKPQKVKHLLSQYGETNRIFLAPEDPKSYARRVRFGGNKRRMFVEGWIEFIDKRKAKLVAQTLNTQKIGGKKGSFYHDDLWNLKYLPKFKWDDLTAQIAAENASRQARLAAEIEQGKREASHYLKNAERAKMIKKIQKTRAEREGDGQRKEEVEEQRVRRHFNQRDVKDKTKAVTEPIEQDKKMTKVMESIFG